MDEIDLLVDIKCYNHQEFSLLTVRDLHNLVRHGYLFVNIACGSICKVGLIETPRLYTSPPGPIFSIADVSFGIFILIALKNISTKTIFWTMFYHI